MSDDAWKPQTQKLSDGALLVHDWIPVRAAIDAAYEAMGRGRPMSVPTEEWNLVALAMDFHAYATRRRCVECRASLSRSEEIRCLDCKAVLCEMCAPRHFWPNGRAGAR